MVTSIQTLPPKELLQRTDIRTMKKDLQQLREADAAKESEKILGDIFTPRENKPTVINSPITDLPRHTSDEFDVAKPEAPRVSGGADQLNWAPNPSAAPLRPAEPKAAPILNQDETQKQQIFLLTSKRAALEKRLEGIVKEKMPPLVTQKEILERQKKNWQEKLQPILEKIRASNSSDGSGDESTEKERWSIEQAIARISDQEEGLNRDYRTLIQESESAKEAMVKIDEQISGIGKQDQEPAEKMVKPHEKEIPAHHVSSIKPHAHHVSVKTIHHKVYQPQEKPQEALSAEPAASGPTLREKIIQSNSIEEAQRRKFMEDVERWAAATGHDSSSQ